MTDSNYAILQVDKLEDNPVPIPRATRICKGPHRYDATIVNNKAVGYVPVTYDRSEHEYPKVLYHPKYGQKAAPEGARYMVGAVTQEQMQSAMAAYEKAMAEWQRSNRIKYAANAEDEERLIKKGWQVKPPQPKEAARFDLDSEEL